MSELQNNPGNSPEKKQVPLTDDCDNCSKKYALTEANTHVFLYTSQGELDHLICKCPHCNYRTRIFIGQPTVKTALDNGIDATVEKNAPEGVYNDWIKLRGIELPKTYELTDRHEAIVRKFGETLLTIPDDVFWDNIEDDTEKPYPQKWID